VNGVVGRAMRSEWTKLRSVRSTTWATIAAIGVMVGLTAFLTANSSTDANQVGGGPGDNDIIADALFGVWLGQIAIVALGVLAMTTEFATGTIRATFSANPRRSAVFWSKAGVVSATALVVCLTASVLSFVVAQPLLHEGGYAPPAYPAYSLWDPIAARAVLGTAVYLTLLALLGMAIGAIVRHTAAAMTLAVALVLAPTVLMGFFTGSIRELMQWISPVAGQSIQVTVERFDNPPYGPWVGLGITASWAAVALIVAARTLRRRDV
jgi:ABC-type transport system involved in multi-copper enzyme maturation permease subunit